MNKEGEKPKVLYHYCSADAFYNIIKNHSIWLSDLTNTNDSKELIWVKEAAERVVTPYIQKRIQKGNTDEFWRHEYVKAFLNLVGRQVFCWGFCLSEKDDNLGQWRGYGDDGTGICIGFDFKTLNELIPKCEVIEIDGPKLTFGEIYYKTKEGMNKTLREQAQNIVSNEKKRTMLRELVNATKIVFSGSGIEIPKVELLPKTEESIAVAIVAMTVFPFYKSEGFEEEAEYRIVFSIPRKEFSIKKFEEYQWASKLKFKEFKFNEETFVSHLDIELVDMKDVIKSITIGPKSKLTKQEVELILRWYGVYSDNIEIKKSAATYW